MRLVAELRRRGVLRAVLAYAFVTFAVLQVIEPVLHGLRLPEWFLTAVIVALGLGFPVTVVVSWAFDLTLRGFQRAAPAPVVGDGVPMHASRWPLFVMTLAGVLVGSLVSWLAPRVVREAPRITVAAADFTNETHDDDLNALSGLLITSLEQSRRLSVMTRLRMFDVLKQLGRGNADRIDEALGREICKQAHVDALVLASIHKFGDLYAIDVKVLDAARNEHLFAAKEEGRGKESIPGMIDRLSERTRAGLREKAEQIAEARRPVAQFPAKPSFRRLWMSTRGSQGAGRSPRTDFITIGFRSTALLAGVAANHCALPRRVHAPPAVQLCRALRSPRRRDRRARARRRGASSRVAP